MHAMRTMDMMTAKLDHFALHRWEGGRHGGHLCRVIRRGMCYVDAGRRRDIGYLADKP